MKKIVKWLLASIGYEVRKKQYINFQEPLYKEIYSNKSLSEKKFYNIGAGKFFHFFWTNVDFYNDWYKEDQKNIGIHYDLMSNAALPIESNSAEIIYTSHVVEHITDDSIKHLFSEVHRILKRGGVFRVTAPDINIWYRAFKNNDRLFFRDSIKYYSNPEIMNQLELNSMNEASIGSIFQYYFSATTSPLTKYDNSKKFNDEELKSIFEKYTYEDALTYICSFCKFDPNKAGYHINWVNAKKIEKILKEVGFSEVYISAYGQSHFHVLQDTNFFDNTVPELSFYVEAKK